MTMVHTLHTHPFKFNTYSTTCGKQRSTRKCLVQSIVVQTNNIFFCQLTFSTRYLALSASCCATCFCSTADVNSCPNVKCVYKEHWQLVRSDSLVGLMPCRHGKCWQVELTLTKEISSRITPNWLALSVSSSFTLCDTISLWVISSLASNWAYQ